MALSSVLRVMRTRRHIGHRRDEYKLGLVLPSGGIGGVRTAGMLASLEHFGFGAVFDVVYGASVGAHNGCYFLSRNSVRSSRGYDIVSTNRRIKRQLFSFTRLLSGKSIFNLDRFYDIMSRENPVDWDAFWNNPTQLKIIATCPEKAAPVLLPPFRDKTELILALRASSFIPIIAKPNIPYQGKLYVDGGFTAPVPWRFAIEDGCTHVLIIKGWQKNAIPMPPPRLLRYIAYMHPEGRQRYPKIFEQYETLHRRIPAIEHDIKQHEEASSNPHLLHTHQADTGQEIGTFPVSNRRLVYDALIANFRKMTDLLQENAETLPHALHFENNPLRY